LLNYQQLSCYCPIVLIFDTLVHCGFTEAGNCENPFPVKSKMADGPHFRHTKIAITPPRIVRFC